MIPSSRRLNRLLSRVSHTGPLRRHRSFSGCRPRTRAAQLSSSSPVCVSAESKLSQRGIQGLAKDLGSALRGDSSSDSQCRRPVYNSSLSLRKKLSRNGFSEDSSSSIGDVTHSAESTRHTVFPPLLEQNTTGTTHNEDVVSARAGQSSRMEVPVEDSGTLQCSASVQQQHCTVPCTAHITLDSAESFLNESHSLLNCRVVKRIRRKPRLLKLTCGDSSTRRKLRRITTNINGCAHNSNHFTNHSLKRKGISSIRRSKLAIRREDTATVLDRRKCYPRSISTIGSSTSSDFVPHGNFYRPPSSGTHSRQLHMTSCSSSCLSSDAADESDEFGSSFTTNDEGREADDEQSDWHVDTEEHGKCCHVQRECQHTPHSVQSIAACTQLRNNHKEVRMSTRRLKDSICHSSVISSMNEKVAYFVQDPSLFALRVTLRCRLEEQHFRHLASIYSLVLRRDSATCFTLLKPQNFSTLTSTSTLLDCGMQTSTDFTRQTLSAQLENQFDAHMHSLTDTNET